MEVEEMDHTYLVPIYRELCLIEKHAWWADQVLDQLQLYKLELRFLDRFSGWVTTWDFESEKISERLKVIFSMKYRFRYIWREGKELAARLSEIRGGYITYWDELAWQLNEKLMESKPVIEKWCKELLSLSVKRKAPQSNEIFVLLDAILNNLNDLFNCKAGNDVPLKDQIETLEWKLVFLQYVLKLNTKSLYNKDFEEVKKIIHDFAKNAACRTFLHWLKVKPYSKTDILLSGLLLGINTCMPLENDSFFPTIKYEASTSDDIVRYIDGILNSLKHLVSYKASMIIPFKKQIETLEEKLVFLQNFLKLAANCVNSEEFEKFMISVHDVSQTAASLTVHYWLQQGDERLTIFIYNMVSHMVQKIEPCTPDVTAIYFGNLKAMKLQQSDTYLLGQTIVSFVDLLLKNLVTSTLKDNDLQILWEELVFVLTFLAHPPMENANDDELTLVLQQIEGILKGGCHLISSLDKNLRNVSNEIKVRNFLRDIETVNERVRRLYCKFPYSSIYDFPKIIGHGFLDFLMQYLRNLKEKLIIDTKCVPFAKKIIWKIEEELVSLRPLFNDISEMEKNQKELSDTWLQVINLFYLTEHAVNSCLVLDFPIWYHMAHLQDVLNRMKAIKIKFKKINECNVYNAGVLPCSGSSTSILSKQDGTSDINQVVVGFEEEASTIIDQLTCGHKSLDIVSIVGMPGIGKTTLAKIVFGAPSVKRHFHIFAFCSVSRDQNAKRLLLDILSNIIVIDDVSGMTEHDLAHKLKKCLSGRKYLIVMDDMWEISVWNEVKSSFPDDQNGSRVVFTTRFNKVAIEAQIKWSPYYLGFLSDEKSWELLQKRVFPSGSCSPEFSDVGKLIAKNCNGLPLAVVVIAGLLARTEPSLNWWSEIAERIGSFLFEEGCMDMLEFSYKHLPEYLKPMLLYFGAFPEDTLISVKSLMMLWIAEGFVHESKTKSLEDVAKDHLHDLVDRSLIFVTGKSSNGEVKTVGIHDLIHDFCRKKARTENFFQLTCGVASSSSSHNPIYNHYRVCMQMACETTVDAAPTFPCVHSLLSFQRRNDPFDTLSINWKLKLVQVLHLDDKWLNENDLEQMSLLFHLRHIVALVNRLIISVPSSISNLWALETLILRTMSKDEIILPETIWEMKWLRHVNITRCRLTFPSRQHEHEHEAHSKLLNVESFSSPILSTGKNLLDLLQRLPAVRKLSCHFNISCNSIDKRVETLDFLGKLESLNLVYIGDRSPYVMKFPSTLKKLKLVGFKLPWTAISEIGKLEHLEVMKLLWNSFDGPRWETEDVVFPSLKFLKLNGLNLVHWDAFTDSFPCLEQLLVIGCEDLVEIPICFGEVLILKRFEVYDCKKATNSAIQIKNEQMDMGNDTLEVDISNAY